MSMSWICISLYFGRIISPTAGFSLSIFWFILISHFGSTNCPVLGLYSIRLWWLRFVKIVCSFSCGIPVSLASCLMLFTVFSSIIVRRSAVVGIGLNLCVQLLKALGIFCLFYFWFFVEK